MYILVLIFPLLGAIISGLLGRRIGIKGAGRFTSTCIGISALVSFWIFYETVLNSSPAYVELWRWIDTELLTVNFGLQFDSLTASMLVLVTSVSTLVHIYSTGYMSGDPHIPRFMSYLSLFTFLMIVLVTSENYIQLFIGWEGVGLCSYLLINFWLTRIEANKAAMKAMLINRVGDIGLILAMIKIITEFGTLNFSTLYAVMSLNEWGDVHPSLVGVDKDSLTMICLLLFLGAVGKSAQFGLHTWLPDAMEGPTPVSALIHAATMVTAGVFLIIRSGPLFEGSPFALSVVTVLGALTAFFAATTGLVQNDLKKVIAYSTCSQLGYMVMVCGLSCYSTGLFHLVNHGFFKALLFLSAGSVIHAISNEQDMRKMGGLLKAIPFTFTMILIGSLSLMGVPYLTGFYSKDLILELTYGRYYVAFAYWLASFSALLTAFYSIRLIYLTFIADTNLKKRVITKVHESTWNIVLPLLLLAFGSIFVGYLGKEVVISNTLPPMISNLVKVVPLILSLSGALLAFVIYKRVTRATGVRNKRGINRFVRVNSIVEVRLGLNNEKSSLSQKWLTRGFHIGYTFLNSAWGFNYVINHFIINNVLKFGHLVTYKILDRGILETIGPKGLSKVLINLTQAISNYQSGLVFNYALILIIFTTFFISGASVL